MPQSQYDPGYAAFGGGSSQSILHPVVLAAMIIAVLLTFLLPRKYVAVPLLLCMLLTPSGQNLYVGGMHFFIGRIVIIVAWLRLLSSKPSSGRFLAGGFGTLDKLFLMWATCRALAGMLLVLQAGAVMGQVALLVDAVGSYFLFRSLIRDDEDIKRVVKVFAVVALVAALGMIWENLTGQNVFGLLGGIRSTPEVRNGRLRAQGVFAISILAGTFGATTFPLFLWLWKRGRDRIVALIGAISSTIMVFACASSTPVMAWFGGILAVCLWPVRKKMRLVRWGIVLTLVAAQIMMKAPVWFILAHIDVASGSGWERANLIDMFIRHVGDWWLIGTLNNVNWGWDMWDTCNQFVAEGVAGGLITLTCFIAMFVICFKRIGNARKVVAGDRKKEWLFWLLGVTMFAQVLAYMGIDYFDQSKFVWYTLLSIIPAATLTERMTAAKESQRDLVPVPVLLMPVPETSDIMTTNGHSGRAGISSGLFE